MKKRFLFQVGLSDENSDGIKEKIIEYYQDFQTIDTRPAQDQFVYQLSQTNTYGMIHLDLKV